MTCVVDATAPPGASLAREPPTMRVNPVTRTPTPRYAPGRRRRACHQTPTRIRGPTRESADPRANERVHVRGEERRQLALGAVSHAIRLGELSTVSTNVVIPTIRLRGETRCRGNCMRHWGCAQVVDVLFMRLLSRPLGVVRIRWGICRRGWCGCGGGCRSLRSRWRPRCRPGRGW